MLSIEATIAKELSIQAHQVDAAITLLDTGNTVPFIARYRKEVTQGLDDTQLRMLSERLEYLRSLNERKTTILKSLEEQNVLTEELKNAVLNVESKSELEDIYRPYKPKRQTKGQKAKEAGLEPLAKDLYDNPNLLPEQEAEKYLNDEKGVKDIKAALDGAKYILMEQFADLPDLYTSIREKLWEEGVIKTTVCEGKEKTGEKFQDYFNYQESINKVPSHRMLAIIRGRSEDVLRLTIELPDQEDALIAMIAGAAKVFDQGRPCDKWLSEVVRWTWKIKLEYQIEAELITRVKTAAEKEAISVFAENLRDLLMAAPAGFKRTMGLDPGYRTGVKLAIVDETGKLLATDTIYPHAPQKKWDEALEILAAYCLRHHVDLISIGNGTASRETDALAAELLKKYSDLKAQKIVVSEAGASVYSASELAANEFPDLDVSLRGAVSIARRLQDPLAELVKIDPKSIGVGQYQHDVNQSDLSRKLDAVVEDCVNSVGVDLNTASSPLLSRIAGLNQTVAENIVKHRDDFGAFSNRLELKKVSRLGPKAFEQSIGFLRIMSGENPLDRSGVHPESYEIVKKVAEHTNLPIESLIGNVDILTQLDAKLFVTDKFGLPTIVDIIKELEKPGRDPRPEFKMATFKEGVHAISDLKPNMILEGTVTNVTNFGAFVDIGVHQDGLVHISCLSNTFVKNPRDVVKTGDLVKVKVLDIEPERKRISLTMRLDDKAEMNKEKKVVSHASKKHFANDKQHKSNKPKEKSAFASALEKALN